MLNNGCDYFHTELFMGHKLPGTQEHYFRANVDKLKEYYTKFIPYLTIEKELDISESPEYLAIKNENAILSAETERHVISRQEFQELRNMIGSLRTNSYPGTGPICNLGGESALRENA
jgi:hypothetical protein